MTTSTIYLPKTNINTTSTIKWYNENQLLSRGGQAMRKITAEELVEKIEELTLIKGVENWRVTEDFDKFGSEEYYLKGLKLELDDDALISSDMDNVIFSDITRVLNGFLVSSIVNIKLYPNNVINIYLKDGSITIKPLD